MLSTVTHDEVKRLREDLGWSQADLADAARVSRTTVSRWELAPDRRQARRVPRTTAALLERIAREQKGAR